jgi:hypothetical protein
MISFSNTLKAILKGIILTTFFNASIKYLNAPHTSNILIYLIGGVICGAYAALENKRL